MKKVIVLGASNSKNSINKELAIYAAQKLNDVELEVLDLNDFNAPIYSYDLEVESGIPQEAKDFSDKLDTADAFVISFAEHNGAYTAAFKSIYDWASRIQPKVWRQKPVLLLATSPGGRGGQTVLQIANNSFPHMGANVVGSFSLPSFGQNFSEGTIVDVSFEEALQVEVKKLQELL